MNPLFASKQKRQIGREYPIKGEDDCIFKMVQDVRAQLKQLHGPGSMRRQAHPKQHGLVQAEFIVNPEELDEEYRVGLFATQKKYPAWIRFSSFNTTPRPDFKKDVRGMAIKLTEVPGHKLLSSNVIAETQDFLLVSNETFSAKNAAQFQRLVAIVTGRVKGFKKIIEVLANLRALLRAAAEFIRVGNLLQIPYWSTTPYQFGNEDRAVKYHVRPRTDHQDPIPKKPTDSYLRETMIETLLMHDVWFDFMVQFQEDANKMPIEDATVKWKSPFIKIASIRIPKQQFASQEELMMGRNMTFSPWHSLPEHRPLGGLNRARKAIYSEMAAFRLKQNEVQATNAELVPHLLRSPKSSSQNTSFKTNSMIVQEILGAFQSKNLEKVMSFLSDEVVWIAQGDPKAIPFAGTYNGKEAILNRFVQQEELIAVETFQLKSIVGGKDQHNTNEPVVVIINEKVLVKDTKKTYEMDFILNFYLKDQQVVLIESLMDSLAVARAFDSVS